MTVFEMVEMMTEEEYVVFTGFFKAWGDTITEEELEAIVDEHYGLTLEEYLGYFDDED